MSSVVIREGRGLMYAGRLPFTDLWGTEGERNCDDIKSPWSDALWTRLPRELGTFGEA